MNGAGRLISKCRHVVIAPRVSIGFADALDAFPACSAIPGFGGRNGCDPYGRIRVALLMPEPLIAAVAISPDAPESGASTSFLAHPRNARSGTYPSEVASRAGPP